MYSCLTNGLHGPDSFLTVDTRPDGYEILLFYGTRAFETVTGL
jgi:hypothetical protein